MTNHHDHSDRSTEDGCCPSGTADNGGSSDDVRVLIDTYGRVDTFPDVIDPAAYSTNGVEIGLTEGSVSVFKRPEPLIRGVSGRPNSGLEYAIWYDVLRRGMRLIRGPHERPIAQLREPIRHPEVLDSRPAALIKQMARCLVEYGPTVHPHELLSDLVLQYRKQTFAIVTSSILQAHTLHKRLRESGISSRVVRADRPCQSGPGKIVTGTWTGMADDRVESGKRDLFIVMNATDVLHRYAALCLSQPDFRCRLVGFYPSQASLSRYEHDALTAVFGFERAVIPAIGIRELSPEIRWWVYTTGGLSQSSTILEVKKAIWFDAKRNRRLAALAREVDAGTGNALGEAVDQVILLVDSVEQAAALADALPGWPVRLGEDPLLDGLRRRHRRALEASLALWPTGERWIVTPTAARQIELRRQPGRTAVIWAGAGPGLPPVPEAWLFSPVGSDREISLIDVDERHHPLLRRWRQSRQEAYDQAEWLAPDQDIIAHRVEQFLARCQGDRR